jgi:hypothetical protein
MNPRGLLVAAGLLAASGLVATTFVGRTAPPESVVAMGDGIHRVDSPDRPLGVDSTDGSSTPTAPTPGAGATVSTRGSGSPRTARPAGSTATTTTTGRAGGPSSPPPAVVAPPAPDGRHTTYWGQVLDEGGRPVEGVCVRILRVLPIQAPTMARTDANGRYVATVEDDGTFESMTYTVAADVCPGQKLDLLPAVGPQGPDHLPLRSRAGELIRTDLAMPLAPTTIDVSVVDPAGRPVRGICVGWWDTRLEVAKRAPVDDRGHAQIDRPGTRSLTVHVLGVCDRYLGWSASTSYGIWDVPGGASSIRQVAPWSSGDSVTAPLGGSTWNIRFDLLALSTEAGEPNPSCVGAFDRSRWISMASSPYPGTPFMGGPTIGGWINSSLSRGGTIAVWGLSGSGDVVELGCARAGTSISLPAGHAVINIQVIPDGDVAQVGALEWSTTSGVPS